MKKKAIIIGAGPAGITAGCELLRQSDDYEVQILEECHQVGGISKTVTCCGNRMDLGGHRFFSKDKDVMNWWESIMPMQGSPAYDDIRLQRTIPLQESGPDPETEDRVMLTRTRVSRIYYGKKFFDYPVKMNLNTVRNLGAGTTIKAGMDYIAAMIHKLPEDSLENFYINRFGKKLYSMFFQGYTQKLWGRAPENISADWGAQRVKGLSITAILKDNLKKLFKNNRGTVETSLIEEFRYPKYGPGQLWELAADDFAKKGGQLNMGCSVIGVITERGRIKAVEYEKDGKKFTESADCFISSMPLAELVGSIAEAPKQYREIAAGLPYRDFVTVGLLVDRLKLENKTKFKTLNGIIPDCWIYVQDPDIKMGRIQIFNNWSPYMVANPEKSVWIGLEYFCDEGDRFWQMSDDEWKSLALNELKQMDILDAAAEPDVFHCEKIKKAYPAYFDAYSEIETLISWLDGYENLYCVGRNGQHRYNNMDHSMVTAFEAVKNILTGTHDKSNIWNVNTEQEYHEEKTGDEQ